MYLGQGCKSPRAHAGWELDRGAWAQPQCKDWWWLQGDSSRGQGTGNPWWRMSLEEILETTEAGCYCWVMWRSTAVTVASLSSHACTGNRAQRTTPARGLWAPGGPSNGEGPVRKALWASAARGEKRILIESYHPCPWPLASLHSWHRQGSCNQSSCTTSMPSPHWSRPKSFRASLEANSCGWCTCRNGDKTTTELQGQSNKGWGLKTFLSAV